jgi:hypothetical protein
MAVETLHRPLSRFRSALLGVAALAPAGAIAQDVLMPYVGMEYEYTTNVFALPSEEQAQLQNGEDKLDDSMLFGIVGAALDYRFGRQRLRAEAEGRYEQFLHFDQLKHSEYRYGAALDWRASDVLDGNVGFGQQRQMPSFVERPGSSELNLETEQHAFAGANVQINPTWRLETGVTARQLDSPLPDAPEFELSEEAGRAALNYLGAQSLTLGTYFEYIAGEFIGIPNAREYTQETWGFSASYGVPKLYGLGVEVGFTDRQDKESGLEGVSGPTGRISYRRQISGKTLVGVNAFREIHSDALEGGFVDDYGLEAGIATQATGKSEVGLAWQFRRSKFQNALDPERDEGRKDRMHTILARWDWEATRSLHVRTHLGYQTRDSNLPLFRFDGVVFGVGFVFARRPPDDAASRLVGVRRDLIDGVLPAGSIPQ